MARYIQRSEKSNEWGEKQIMFDNMPSADYKSCCAQIVACPLTDADKTTINEIADKHGFKVKVIHSTFGTKKVAYFFYKKVTKEQYENRYKYADLKNTLQELIHELDEETPLYFETRSFWSEGKQVKYFPREFEDGKHLREWVFSSSIFDSWFEDGYYLCEFTYCVKIDPNEIIDEELNYEVLRDTAKEMFPKLNIDIVNGKRGCDGEETYNALLIYNERGSYLGQLGSITLTKDKYNNVYRLCKRVPLCGECSFKLGKDTWRDELKHSIEFML